MQGEETTQGGAEASRHLDAPTISKDLFVEAAALRAEAAFRAHGHNARTLAKYPDLRVVLMVFKAGSSLGRHEADDAICVHALKGHVRVILSGQDVDLPAGSLVTLERGKPHDVLALEDSEALLTIGWNQPEPKGAG